MRENDNGKKKIFSLKDIIIIVLCLVSLVVLVFILKKSQETKQMEQQQLSDIKQELQQSGNNSLQSAVSATNTDICLNEINQDGWIELYNDGKEEISLEGIIVCVNGEERKTISEKTTLAAGGLLVIETGEGIGDNSQNLITLLDAEKQIFQAVIVPELKESESYGCVENGSVELSYLKASKGTDNTEEQSLLKEELSFSIPGGFYTNAITLEINVPEGKEVYYTLDGTEPTTDSLKYEAAINITNRSGSNYQYVSEEMTGYMPSSIYMGTVVRAIAVDEKGKTVEAETESYFIGLGNNSDMYNIPVISITTNPENLFDYFEGIYVSGRSKEDAIVMNQEINNVGNYWNLWSKEAHIEYFENNKAKTYEGNVNLSILQDYSIENHQKGFKITGIEKGAWKGSALYEYFNEESNTLLLQTNKRDNISKLREYLANELLKDTEVGISTAKPCIVFIDGEYWGAYMLREVFDEAYVKRQYGLDEDTEVLIEKNDVFNNWDHHVLYDEFYNFIKTTDMSVQENYDKVKEMMDVQSYLDYFCANVYLANADYGSDEGCMWRTVSKDNGYADGRWRWSVGKLDNSMNNITESKRTTATIDTYKMPEIARDEILTSLFRNQEFREQLAATMVRMSEEIFECLHVEETIKTITAKNEKMVLSSYERFYGQNGEQVYKKELENIKAFFENRTEYILYYTEEIMDMGEQWYQYTVPVEEERAINEQETITEHNRQRAAETLADGVS